MHIIGLTGGIASGKSSAAAALRAFGAEVIDADAIAKELTAPEGAAAPAVLARFGTLDRRVLGKMIFSDERARRDLNAIVHPLVHTAMEGALSAATAPVVVVDVPLLYESGMEGMADEVWVVHVPRETQIERVMARDALPREEAVARVDSQMPTEEKMRRADACVDTSGPPEETRARLFSLYQKALERAGERT